MATSSENQAESGGGSLHHMLDWEFPANGLEILRQRLADGCDLEAKVGDAQETLLHVATRRRRLEAVQLLVESGCDIEAQNAYGKTAYAHAVRRGFAEIADYLADQGADQTLSPADQLAVALTAGNLDQARLLLNEHPAVANTGNPGEDRLLADLAGRFPTEPVQLLIDAGADLSAKGLDGGTALHQTAWFGQPQNAQLLIAAGAPLDGFDNDHQASPLHWAVHGSRYSGAADERQAAYLDVVEQLLAAGSSWEYPDRPGDESYRNRLLEDASPQVEKMLREWLERQA